MDRDEMMRRIHQAHAARLDDELDGVMTIFHADAAFRLAGSAQHMSALVDVRGHDQVREAMAGLIEAFEFLKIEEVQSVVEYPCAAVHWRALVRYRPSGDVVETDLCDIWRFAEDGRAISLLQFCDTALVRALVGEVGG